MGKTLILVEGPERVGKSTLVEELKSAFQRDTKHVEFVKVPFSASSSRDEFVTQWVESVETKFTGADIVVSDRGIISNCVFRSTRSRAESFILSSYASKLNVILVYLEARPEILSERWRIDKFSASGASQSYLDKIFSRFSLVNVTLLVLYNETGDQLSSNAKIIRDYCIGR